MRTPNATEHYQYFQEKEISDLHLYGSDVLNLGTEYTGVPPYPLIQYHPRFQLSAVYRGLKKLEN
jgi:hypothetical protein